MKRKLIAIISAAIAGLGVFWLIARSPTGSSQATPQVQADAYAVSQAKGKFHLPSSADKVEVSAWVSAKESVSGEATIKVQLHIDQGWHVNANPASIQFLIPTTLRAEAAGRPVTSNIQYPPGRDSNITLGGKKIRVYDDKTTLAISLPRRLVQKPALVKKLAILVTVQSCSNQGVCLPPARLRTAPGAGI